MNSDKKPEDFLKNIEKRAWKHIEDKVLFRKQREIQASEKKAKKFMDDYKTPNLDLPRGYLEQKGWKLQVDFVWSSGRYNLFEDYFDPKSVKDCGYMFRKENKLLRLQENHISIQDYLSRNFLYSGECKGIQSFEEIMEALKILRK